MVILPCYPASTRLISALYFQIRDFILVCGDTLKYLARKCYHMAAEGEADTDRTAVRTYVPAYQREAWDEHADELDMSRSEYVRTMVQAGRRGFDEFAGAKGLAEDSEGSAGDQVPGSNPAQADNSEDEPGGSSPTNGIEESVVDLLEDDCLGWEELFDALTADIENQLESVLNDLQAENRIQYSGRNGGYVLAE